MTTTPISFRWSAEFVAEIDKARGLVSRSRFVRAAIERCLDGSDVMRGAPRVDVNYVPAPPARLGKGDFTPRPKGAKR